MPVLAVIDVGSNTVRLLVAEGQAGGHYRLLEQARETTRLGQGLSEGKPLLACAQERTLTTLRDFSQRARRLGAQTIRALGTSALRRAGNTGKFVLRVKQCCGLKLEVVSGMEEARLTLQGVGTVVPSEWTRYLASEIGGGSSEFILADGQGGIEDLCSLELGAVSLTERFLAHDPPHECEFNQLIKYLHQRLFPILQDFPPAPRLVGTAGTITTLAAVAQGMEEYDAGKINGFILPQSQVAVLLKTFRRQPLARRRQIPGLEAKRADIIVAGTAVLLVGMEELKADQIMVSDAGFREGIVVELLKR
jgi:exopolyphosphatase/guanosine-5'-triphosphate,3'-diphosphate pyrophosphatase